MAYSRTNDFAVPFGGRIVKKVWQFGHTLFTDHYRPELHYMRGPGPKWREKHAHEPAEAGMGTVGLSGFGKAGA